MTSTPIAAPALSGRATADPVRSAPKGKRRDTVSDIIALVGSRPQTLAEGAAAVPRGDEHFLPVTVAALVDRLAAPHAWPPGEAAAARRLYRVLEYWRQQRRSVELMQLAEAYEPFSPDSDLFVTRTFTDAERRTMKAQVTAGVERLVRQANYNVVPRERVAQEILSSESHYGLDLRVDFDAFEELLVCHRGESVTRSSRRVFSTFFRKQEFDVPIYRRLMVMFKLKPVDVHAAEIAAKQRISIDEARKLVLRLRERIPPQIKPENIYIKIFKNMPKSDIEMVFPNTEVKFRMKDKIWLGVTGSSAVGAGLFGAAGKLALVLTNPIAALGAMAGIMMVLFRQFMNVFNQKQRYMQVLAQNLYFHSMADNRGALSKLADRSVEEDVKEEILLYSVLAKERVNRRDLDDVDAAIQTYIERTFGLQVDFDLQDALSRLIEDGIVTEQPDGTLVAKPPKEAAEHIDQMWDKILDMIQVIERQPGREVEPMPTRGQYIPGLVGHS